METSLETHLDIASTSVEDLIQQVDVYLAKGELDQARSCCYKAMELNSSALLVNHHLGRILFEQSNTGDAIIHYQREIELNPDFFWSYQGLGEAFFNHGQLDDAISYFRKAVKLNSTFIWSHQYLGEALALKDFVDEAIHCYERAIELDSNCERAHYRLGDALIYQGKQDQAILAYQKARVLQQKIVWTEKKYIFTQDWFTPNIPIWLEHLQDLIGQPQVIALEIGSFEGMSTCWMLDTILTHQSARITCIDPYAPYLGLENPIWLHLKFAENLFNYNISTSDAAEKVTKIKATSKQALVSLQEISYDFVYIDGDHRASSVLLDAASTWKLIKVGGIIIFNDYEYVSSSNPVQETKAGIDIFLSIFKDQLEILHRGYQLIVRKTADEENYTIYYELGLALAEFAEPEEAIVNYCHSIKLNPNFYRSYQKLAEILASNNQLEEAIVNYQKAIELDPKAHLSYLYLAHTLEHNNQLEEAIRNYYQSIECQQDSSIAHHHLGQALAKLGRLNNAIQAYNRAIELDPTFSWSHHLLGETLALQGRWDEAIPYYRTAIQLNPDFWGSYEQLGDALNYGGHSFRVYPWIGNFLIETGRLDETIVCYRESIKLNPNNSHSYVQLGNALTAKNEISEAILCYQQACYQKVIRSKPELARAEWKWNQIHKPDFLIIGAGKAGTTSVYEYLTTHPQILPAAQKEIDFFSHFFDKDTSWYLSQFPPIFDDQEFLTGEATPSYLVFPGVEQKVFALLPNTKLIVLLRNPANRTISHYYENLKFGQENRSLKEAVMSEIELLETATEDELINGAPFYQTWGYVLHSLYFYSLKRWMDCFLKEQFLIIKSEDLYTNPSIVVNQLFNFLGVSEFNLDDYPNYYPRVEVLTPNNTSEDNSMHQILIDYFRPHTQRLEEYLDKKFNWE